MDRISILVDRTRYNQYEIYFLIHNHHFLEQANYLTMISVIKVKNSLNHRRNSFFL